VLEMPKLALVGSRIRQSKARPPHEEARDRHRFGEKYQSAYSRRPHHRRLRKDLDRTYPDTYAELAERILETGFLISALPPRALPLPHQLVQCNRIIISGLWVGDLVVEADARRGSLITA